jgi:MFS family permease
MGRRYLPDHAFVMSRPKPGNDPSQLSPERLRRIALLVAAALFMENLDGTIIATALPQIARSFSKPVITLNIGMTAYLLTVGIFIPLSGWLSGRLGVRLTFAGSIGLFVLASIGCAASSGLTMFVIARIVQGMAAAMMTPVGRLFVLARTEKHDLISAVALLTWPALIAPVIAPPLGGFIVEYASWPWIFLLNVPLGLVGIVMALRLLPRTPRTSVGVPDLIAFILWGCRGDGVAV